MLQADNSIAGVVFAGGRSRRFGSDKAEAVLGGVRLIDRVINRLAPQVGHLAISGAELPGYPKLADGAYAGRGPLAGLWAGLSWAQGFKKCDWLVTAPCDVPFLPLNLAALLLANAVPAHPTALEVDGHLQAACALWPVSALPFIHERLVSQDLALHGAFKALGGTAVRVPADRLDGSFLNVNRPEDLERAELILLMEKNDHKDPG